MVIALRAGECVVCLEPYPRGEELGLVAEDWAHISCYDLVLTRTVEIQLLEGASWNQAIRIIRVNP